MPKELIVDPAETRAKSCVEFSPIPVNQYDKTVTDELASGSVTN